MDRYTRAPAGPVRDPAGTCTGLLYFMQASGEPLGAQVPEGGPRSLCRESSPCVERDRRTFHQRIRGRRQFTAASKLSLLPARVEDFESSFGLELLATVHWVAAADPTASTEDVVAGTYAWDERKRAVLRRADQAGARRSEGKGLARGLSSSDFMSAGSSERGLEGPRLQGGDGPGVRRGGRGSKANVRKRLPKP